MSYIKKVWQDEDVSTPFKFTKSLESASTVTLVRDVGTITNQDPISAVELNRIEDGIEAAATTESFLVTIPSTSWIGIEPVTKTITVIGILSTDNPTWGYVPTGNYATDLIIRDDAGLIIGIETLNGSIIVTAIEAPSANIPIVLKVVR